MTPQQRLVWTERAVRDVEGVLGWIEAEQGPDAAFELFEIIEAGIDTLRSMPERCRVVAELREHGITAYRELVQGHYRIVFRVREGDVLLLGVLDHRRDLEEILLERAFEDDHRTGDR